jgi:hypothetical protein
MFAHCASMACIDKYKSEKIMLSCNFSKSFMTFVTQNRGNNARIQVESKCEIFDQEKDESENYYLVASCKGEDTYGKGRLFLVPSYDFCMIYSSKDFMIIRTHYNADRDNTTIGDNRGYFLDVHFHINMVEAEILESNEAIVQSTLANRVLNGQVEIKEETGRYKAKIEFPIKTMNVNDINTIYQVDTGPILIPDFSVSKERMVERFKLAYVAYNRNDEAYFVIQEPTSIIDESNEKVSFYSKVISIDTKNTVIALSI